MSSLYAKLIDVIERQITPLARSCWCLSSRRFLRIRRGGLPAPGCNFRSIIAMR